MILAQNHLLRLNGNKWLWLLIGCFWVSNTNAATVSSVFRDAGCVLKLDTIPRAAKVDTVTWKLVDTFSSKAKDIKVSDTASQINQAAKINFKMACLIPLYSSLNPESNRNLLRMSHFTLGAQLAAKSCTSCRTVIDVDILDIEKYKNRIDNLVEKDSLSSYDIIVGPYKTDDLKKVLNAKALNHSWIFSPWNMNTSLLKKHPNFVQLTPSLEAHMDAIANDITQNFSSAKTYFVCGKQDKREIAYFDYFRENPSIKNQKLLSNRMELLLIDGKTGSLDTLTLKKAYNEDMHHVYILPYWADHAFVVKFLQNMGPVIAEKPNVTIYGFSQWLSYPQITMDMYERFHIRLSVHGYYGAKDEKEELFKKMFFETYNTVPLEDAFYGYEVFNLIFSAVEKFGLKRDDMLRATFQPFTYTYTFSTPSTENSNDNTLHGLENRGTFMMELKEDRFQKVLSNE